MRNPSYYDLESVDHKSVNAYLSALVEGAFEKLRDARCVAVNDDDDVVEPLSLGRVASFYYLQHSTVALFARTMNARNTPRDLLEILAGAAEYDETPVRHNEDLLNATLADAVVKAGGFPVDARSLDDPHVKANLLFQAHWLRVPLPSSDFVTDAKGALDNAARVLQAMIDVAADAGWLAVTLRLMNLQQALMQGRRAEDPSLCVLPGISLEDARCAAAKARSHAVTKKRKDPNVLGTLPELVALARREVAAAKRALAASAGFSQKALTKTASKALDAAVAVAARLPVIDVDARIVDGELASMDGELASERVTVEVRLRRVETSFSEKRFSEKKTSAAREPTSRRTTPPRAVCPLYPKIKQEGWWVVLGDREANELLALRRVAFGDETRVKLTYEDDKREIHDANKRVVVAFLVSDCYVGMDQETDVVFASRSSLEELEDKEESFWLAPDDPSEFSEDENAFFWENEGRAAR